MSDTNLKTYVNYQMYISVVQENHNFNIKIVFNLAKNFVYFWTVFTKHPVGICQKYRKHFLSEITHRKIPRKEIFTKINIFGIFGPKTEKMGRARK